MWNRVQKVINCVSCVQKTRLVSVWFSLQTSDPPLVSALLTVKGDITESYRVLLMARVVSAAASTG